MNFKKSLFLIGFAALVGLALLPHFGSMQEISGGKSGIVTLNDLAGNSLNGAWKFNRLKSDNATEKMRTHFSAARNDGQTEFSVLATMIFPPETMILAGDAAEMTINENFKDIIQTRTFALGGKIRLQRQNSGIKLFAAAAVEKNNRLVIETVSPAGFRLIETYELSADAGVIRAVLQIFDSEKRELLIVRRVYDRTILDIFSE